MAVIRQYESPVRGLRPDETGPEAFQRAGYRIAAGFREAGAALGRGIATAGRAVGNDVNKYVSQQEVSDISAHGALLSQSFHNQWNEIAKSANPQDQHYGQQFLQNTVEPELEKFQSGFTTDAGRAYAREMTNHIRETMYHTVAADTSTMAADAVVKNLATYDNSTQTTLYQNPELLTDRLNNIDKTVDALVKSYPDLTPDEAAKLRDETTTKLKEGATKSAFLGVADRNPQMAETMLNNGQFGQYLDGAQAHSYIKMAERTQKEEATQARIAANLASRVASENATNGYLSALSTGPDGNLIVPKGWLGNVLKDPNLKPAEKTALYHFAHVHDGRKGMVTDRPTFIALSHDAVSGSLTTDDLVGSLTKGDISVQQYHFLDGLRKEIANSPEAKADAKAFGIAVKGYQHFIDGSNPLTGRYDPQGSERYAEFINAKTDEFRNGLRKGWSRQSMLTPGGEHFIFGDVKNYEVTPTISGHPFVNPMQQQPLTTPAEGQSTTSTAVAAANSVPKLEPGESPQHFVQRLMEWNREHLAGNK